MSQALEGMHYCLWHQGNHSRYDPENCEVCKLRAENDRLKEELAEANGRVERLREAAALLAECVTAHFKTDQVTAAKAALADLPEPSPDERRKQILLEAAAQIETYWEANAREFAAELRRMAEGGLT